MLTSQLKTILRILLKERYFTAVNILGLSLGIAVCLLIWSYVSFELSFDNFHPNVDRTYRVDQTNIWSPEGGMMGSTGPQLALVLSEEFPEVEEALRVNTAYDFLVRYQKPDGQVLAFSESNILAADSGFFRFFGFQLKEGDPKTALYGLDKVVISDRVAKKIFGDEPALGKILEFGEDRRAVEITGVTEKQPDNSHFQFDYLISIYTNPNIKRFEWSWVWTQEATYVRLKEGSSPDATNEKLKSLVDLHVKPSFERMGISLDEFVQAKQPMKFELLPVRDIHLFSDGSSNRLGATGDVKYVYIFSVVAAFVLLLAIVNFINLSTARSASRAKEVGVKKVMGAVRKSLILQFQFESVMMALLATLLGLGFLELLRIVIASGLSMDLPFSIWNDKRVLWVLLLVPFVVGGLAGSYPSFYLSQFKPADVLKGKLATGFRRAGLRNALVLFQFTVSVVFILATIVIYRQLEFFMQSDLGFDKEHVLVISNAERLGESVYTFRDELRQERGVTGASVSMTIPGRGSYEDVFVKDGTEEKLSMSQNKVDEHYMQTLGFSLAAGRFFDEDRPADKLAVIPNEAAVRIFGWTPEEALGEFIVYPDNPPIRAEIIGVMKDYHYASLYNEIAPAIFYHTEAAIWEIGKTITVKFQPEHLYALLATIQHKWNARVVSAPLEYSFLDAEWATQYQQEQRLGGLFGIFAGLSILIAMVGLVGLVTYSAEQRKKEIGVRKVLGASVNQVVFLLNRNFTILVVISFLIAVPLGWYAMNEWLSQFPYRIEVSPWYFVVAGIAMLVVTWLTVSYQSIKAGMTNPVDVLKDE
ncbi:MAG: ABC transporter permease [Cyclobacteriaceae bacterium]